MSRARRAGRLLAGLLFFLSLLLGACSPAPPGGKADISQLTARLDAGIPRWMAASRVPGVSVALVHGGELVWVASYGLANIASGAPVTADSLFGVASISKSITAWGIMKLVEAGKLELDAPVERYLTRWRLPPSEFDSQGVTIRRLLSHSAGLNTPEYLGYLPGAPMPTVEQVLEHGSGHAEGLRLVREPGSKFAYSDGGYLLLQLVLEEVSGEDFASFMQREVLDPLGMTESTFARTQAQIESTVTSYSEKGEPFLDYRFVELAPAGLYTSPADLATFLAAAMRGPNGEPPGRGVLQPASVAAMLSPEIGIYGTERFIYAESYGMGYFLETLPKKPGSATSDERWLASHMGGNLGGVSEVAAIPAEGEGIVVLTTSIAGHEVFADVVTAWTDWLGAGQVVLARAIRTARLVLTLFSLALGIAGLVLAWRLLYGLRSGRRRLGWPGGSAWKAILAPGAALVGLGLYWWFVFPFMRIAMPSVVWWMSLAWTVLCTMSLISVLVSRGTEVTSLQ